MNHLKRIVCVLLCVLQIALFSLPVFAEESITSTGDVEVVLLFDVSGSMKESDPENSAGTRMSLEAAYQFAFKYPSERNMHVTVIPYHSYVYNELPTVNVSTPAGRQQYYNYLEQMRTNTLPAVPNQETGYNVCWQYQTDIGGALTEAQNVLSSSTHTGKKAVILFTDGKVELGDKSAQSKEMALSASKALQDAGIPVYSIGLEYKRDCVDKAFLNQVSGEDKVKIVTSANDLAGVFTEIYAHLLGAAIVNPDGDPDGSVEPEIITPDPVVPTELKFKVYRDAVKEVNIDLSGLSDGATGIARLYTIQVTTPGGIVISSADLRTNTNNSNAALAPIQYSPSGASANIKLLKPEGGEWTISVTGTGGAVMVQQINLFDLKINSNLTTDTVVVGETLKYEASIYNAVTNTHLTTPELYSPEEGARAFAVISQMSQKAEAGQLNAAGNAYEFSYTFDKPGVYQVETTIYHPAFNNLTVEKTVTVLEPKLNAKANASADGSSVIFSLELVDPVSGKVMSAVPAYLKNASARIAVAKDGKNLSNKQVSVALSQFTGGSYQHDFGSLEKGEYTFSATVSYSGGQLSSGEVKATMDAPGLLLTAPDLEVCGTAQLLLTLVSPIDGQALATVPEYLQGVTIEVQMLKNGEVLADKSVLVSFDQFTDGLYAFTVENKAMGEYTFVATANYGSEQLVSESLVVKFTPSKITAADDAVTSLSTSGLSGDWKKKLDISEMFEDSDGDELEISVEVEESFLDAEIDGNELIIRTRDFGKGTVVLVVTDGNGAELRYEISVKNESLLPMVLGIAGGVLAVILAIVIFLIIRKKKSVISFRFKLRMDMPGQGYDAKKAVFVVSPITSKKSGKPTMTLSEILAPQGFGTLESLEGATEADVEAFLQANGANITFTGVPFKRQLIAQYKNPKDKKTKSIRFADAIQTLYISAEEGSIAVGKSNAEL